MEFNIIAPFCYCNDVRDIVLKAHDDHKYKINLSYTNPRRHKDYGNVITGKGA